MKKSPLLILLLTILTLNSQGQQSQDSATCFTPNEVRVINAMGITIDRLNYNIKAKDTLLAIANTVIFYKDKMLDLRVMSFNTMVKANENLWAVQKQTQKELTKSKWINVGLIAVIILQLL